MTFIQPLELKTILISVFSGTPEIFTAIALMVIVGLCAFFRMTGVIMLFFIGLFLLMFSGFITSPLLVLLFIIGGLVIGFILAKVFG